MISIAEKDICATRMNTPGSTISKARELNTYETRPLILRALPGATTTLRLALWVRMKRDGRRLGSGRVFRPANEIYNTIVRAGDTAPRIGGRSPMERKANS